jgi:hypothetical protein
MPRHLIPQVSHLIPPGNRPAWQYVHTRTQCGSEVFMKGILGWLIGIPIPIIVLLYLFDVF